MSDATSSNDSPQGSKANRWRSRDSSGRYVPYLKQEYVVADNGCWLWQGSCISAGYPEARFENGQGYVHRAFYEAHHGVIPQGSQIHHTCSTPRCVNPDHLVAVTPLEHAQLNPRVVEARERGACPQGHPWTVENTGRKGNIKWCRACARARMAAKSRAKGVPVRVYGRLTAETARMVRDRKRAGESATDLAQEFGVSKSTVFKVASGRDWKHLS